MSSNAEEAGQSSSRGLNLRPYIPSGTFLMGHSSTDPLPTNVSGLQPNRMYGSSDERPVMKHNVGPFEMSTTEITNKMYEEFDLAWHFVESCIFQRMMMRR